MQSKEPWGPGTPWKNSTAFFTFLRGCLRKSWSSHPHKLNLLKKRRKQIVNPNPKGIKPTVFGCTCEMCKKDFVLKECQVDHIVSAGKLNKTEDIQGFVERLLYVTEDDLRIVCKSCNSALALADKQGLSYDDAIAEKTAIALCKNNLDKTYLEDYNIVPASSKAKRREQIVEHIKKGKL